MLQNTITPSGTFGWHSHPGPSLVIVKSGTATFYEGNVDLVTVVVSVVPAGFQRRIDENAPPNCPNLPNG